jgi:hypothetical protein
VPDFLSRAGQEQDKAEQFVERALRDLPTLIVLDNCESVLPPVHFGSSRREEAQEKDEGRRMNDEASQSLTSAATESFDPKLLSDLLALWQRLSVVGGTRLIFTTRTPLPEPFDQHHLTIDRLDRTEAIELVGKVLGEDERMPRAASDVENEQQIEALVEAVNCHARSLVLVARELIEHRLPPTTEAIRQIMQALHQKHGDKLNARELSLFASVELSLRRLPKELRQLLPPLAVFQGGCHQACIAHLLSAIGYLPPDEKAQQAAIVLAQALVEVGLAELLPYDYLRLDPALGPALERELSAPQRQAAEAAWADAMSQLTGFLYEQRFKDAHLAATLTLLELPNLLAALEWRFRAAQSAIRNPQSLGTSSCKWPPPSKASCKTWAARKPWPASPPSASKPPPNSANGATSNASHRTPPLTACSTPDATPKPSPPPAACSPAPKPLASPPSRKRPTTWPCAISAWAAP